ncbi:PREDICTED: uncharacterized protein LOC109589649 [Amphimedon queenslandica]|uniref:MANSC domain-containing protein n=1 Tax=Amphimedon queenslandica TaxID=400682 RepID=A0AAN0JWG5_AMPQE|nr:PREDICTED: uncharacterized protein LOC109589649 [Amphimedon queenslandica]|eukprot:XP_019861263.1 PREDICTED: uncharacterized protein LOC109589649 [Amphimedon queenslandica]
MRKGVHFTVVFILLVTSLGGSLSSHRRQPLSYDNQREDKPQDSYDQRPYPDSFHDGDPYNGKEDVDRPYKYNEDTNAEETDEEEDYKYNDKSKETTDNNEYHSSSSDNYHNQDGQDPAEEPDLPPPSYPTAPPSYSCRFHYHSNSLPKGKTKVSYLHFIGAARSYKECADLCCQHGRKCQLGWLFKKKCFAVGCNSAEKDRCTPKAVPYDAKYSSSVVVMSFVKKTNHDSHNKDESSFSSTVVPQPSSSSLSSSSSDYYSSNFYSHSVATTRSSSLSSVVTTTPSSSSSIIKATPHPKPPHGNHRLINNVLTVAVANKHPVITLPTDHIKIFSSTWPDSSPGVTYHYHWRRLFGPKKGNLNGVNDKTISLSHVCLCYREGYEIRNIV